MTKQGFADTRPGLQHLHTPDFAWVFAISATVAPLLLVVLASNGSDDSMLCTQALTTSFARLLALLAAMLILRYAYVAGRTNGSVRRKPSTAPDTEGMVA